MLRMVRILDRNIQAEVVNEQLMGSFVKYYEGGFEITEFVTAEDYEEIDWDED